MTALESLNQSLFLAMNANVNTATWKLDVATVLADYAIFLVPMLLVAMWCWTDGANRSPAIKACVLALIALGVNQVLGIIWPHPRPFAIGLGHTFIAHANDSSFPSDHATVFAAVGVTLLFSSTTRMKGIAVFALGAYVAWSRVYLGVHFPLDMVGAVLVVLLVHFLLSFIWSAIDGMLLGFAQNIYRLLLSKPIALGWLRK